MPTACQRPAPVRKRATLEPFDGLEDNLPAVEYRDGQHIQKPNDRKSGPGTQKGCGAASADSPAYSAMDSGRSNS